MAKDRDYRRMIHSTEWLRLRRDKLTAHPLCEVCEAEGRITTATEVHHREPVEEALTTADKRRLMFDPANLVAVCHECHARLHREMRSHSRDANKERTERKLKAFRAKFL